MKKPVMPAITPENFDSCWQFIDRLRRKSRRMNAIARIGGFFANLFFLFSLLFLANGILYNHFHGYYHAFLDSLPVFPQLWAYITQLFLNPGDGLTAEIGKLLPAAYGLSMLLFLALALLIALLYHPRRRQVPAGTYAEQTQLLSKAAQEAWTKSYQTKISTSMASALLVIVAAFILLFAYTIFREDANEVEAMLSIFPTHDYETNCVIYTLTAYFACHIFSTVLFLLTRFIYRYQFPYDFMVQAEAAALFAQEETEGLTPEEITARRRERAATICEDAIDLEREAAYQKAKKMLHEAALLGDIPAMEHYARHCILSHLNDSAMYWLKKCIATGEASKEAEKMLLRLRLHLNHRVAYLRPEAAPLTKKQKILRILRITITVIWHALILALVLAVIVFAVLLANNNFDLSIFQDLPGAFSQLFS